MNILTIAVKELIGMFIDDGALALLSFILIVAVGYATEQRFVDGTVGAIVLFAGCLLILAESVARAARKKFARK
jgi:hypothetical protein